MNKFLLIFPKSLLTAILNPNHWWPTGGKFYRHEDWLESHHWPNGDKLLIRQPKATGGPKVAQRWQNLPTVRRWATGGMLSGMYLPIPVKIHNTVPDKKKTHSNTEPRKIQVRQYKRKIIYKIFKVKSLRSSTLMNFGPYSKEFIKQKSLVKKVK